MRIYERFFIVLREMVILLQHHGQDERVDILTGIGVYHKDAKSHIHVSDKFKKDSNE